MLNKIKILLGGKAESSIIQFIYEDVLRYVLDYCHLDALPQQLESTVIKMCVSAYQQGGYGSPKAERTISGISEGGASISFSDKPKTDAEIYAEYHSKLNEFRKVVF